MNKKNKVFLIFIFIFFSIKPMSYNNFENTQTFIWLIKEGRKRFPYGSTRNNIKRMLKILEENEKLKKD